MFESLLEPLTAQAEQAALRYAREILAALPQLPSAEETAPAITAAELLLKDANATY